MVESNYRVHTNTPKTASDAFVLRPFKMKSHFRFISYSILLSVLFFSVALSPVTLLGCKLRGLLAFSIALASGVAGIVTGIMALKSRARGTADSSWWLLSTSLLAIPVVAMLVLA